MQHRHTIRNVSNINQYVSYYTYIIYQLGYIRYTLYVAYRKLYSWFPHFYVYTNVYRGTEIWRTLSTRLAIIQFIGLSKTPVHAGFSGRFSLVLPLPLAESRCLSLHSISLSLYSLFHSLAVPPHLSGFRPYHRSPISLTRYSVLVIWLQPSHTISHHIPYCSVFSVFLAVSLALSPPSFVEPGAGAPLTIGFATISVEPKSVRGRQSEMIRSNTLR